MSFADQSGFYQSTLNGVADESLSSTQAQFRHMKAMEDIKKKGKQRLSHFNKQLEHVKEAERKSAIDTKRAEQLAKKKLAQEDLDQVLDREISQGLNSI